MAQVEQDYKSGVSTITATGNVANMAYYTCCCTLANTPVCNVCSNNSNTFKAVTTTTVENYIPTYAPTTFTATTLPTYNDSLTLKHTGQTWEVGSTMINPNIGLAKENETLKAENEKLKNEIEVLKNMPKLKPGERILMKDAGYMPAIFLSNPNEYLVCRDGYWIVTTRNEPPLGLMPKWLWNEKRFEELKAAIARYTEAKKTIPQEWLNEYNELCSKMIDEKKIIEEVKKNYTYTTIQVK